jgi:hypothetical protein
MINPYWDGSSDPQIPLMKPDAVRGRMLVRHRSDEGPPQWLDYSANRAFYPDFGYRMFGYGAFETAPVIKKVVPDGAPIPEIPENSLRKFQSLIEFPVFDPELNLCFLFSCTGPLDKPSINQNRIKTLFTVWGYQEQAVQGLLQKFIVRPFVPVTTANGVFYSLVWEATNDWTERDARFPQPRLQPPPVPVLSGRAPPPKLEHPPESDDPLAAFRPAAAGGRRPY